MALITLLLVVAFTALYLSRSLDKKPEALARLSEKITPHIDQIALWGAVYGFVAALLTLLMSYSLGGMLIRLAGNVMICVMALPFIFDKLMEKYREKVNVAIMDEAKNFVSWITTHEKGVAYTGLGCSAVLFGILFK